MLLELGLDPSILILIVGIGFTAGFIDAIAGGGGLLTIPALLSIGLPPHIALGTNKLQGSMGTATATYMMLKNKRVKCYEVKGLMLAAFIGAMIGAIAIQFIHSEMLSIIIPVVILFIGIYFLVSPSLSRPQTQAKISTSFPDVVHGFASWYRASKCPKPIN